MLQSSPFPRLNSVDNGSERKAGEIQVIFGPMFSGKTTELLRRLRRYHLAEYKCVVVKYAMDNRYSESDVATHDRVTLPAVAATELNNIDSSVYKSCDVIGIDEGQFFPDLVPFCEKMANTGKTVIVAALDGTYMRQGFGDVLSLVPLAESIVKLTAVCMSCYGEAAFTFRKSSDKEVEVIGGAEKYLAVCRRCYNAGNNDLSRCQRKRKAFQEQQSSNKQQLLSKKVEVSSNNSGVSVDLSENQEN